MKLTLKKLSFKFVSVLCAAIMATALFTGCNGNRNTESSSSDSNENTTAVSAAATDETIDISQYENKEAVIEVKDCGTIKVKLEPKSAPITVANFVDLCNKGFYDGLTFHRIISGFMIQGGDPLGTGTGGSEKNIKGEFSANGVENTLSHTRGAISMARSNDPDSASSQFFIVHEDSTYLDGQYAAFGYVTEGMDVVDKLATATYNSADSNGTIADKSEQPVITSIKIQDAE